MASATAALGDSTGTAATAFIRAPQEPITVGEDVKTFSNEEAFFDAWRCGVAIAGEHYFGNGQTSTAAAASKWDLAPRVDDINEAIGWLSSGEALLLAAMVSFYNSQTGGEMLRRLEAPGLSDISAGLDEARRRVIADLLVAYNGW